MGIVIALIALSRQWGFFLFLPILFLQFYKVNGKKYFIFWSISSLIGIALSSWFYIGLYLKYGSFTAFNMKSNGFAFSNQNSSFYFPNYNQLEYLFTKPIRPHLNNQFFSTLYSDLWGDYWGYFSFTSQFLELGRNQSTIGDYLARVNVVSTVTTLILIIFWYKSYRLYRSNHLIQYLNLAVIVSFIGYFMFTILYPNSTGDTIKATFIIQAFHLLVFIASIYFYNLRK